MNGHSHCKIGLTSTCRPKAKYHIELFYYFNILFLSKRFWNNWLITIIMNNRLKKELYEINILIFMNYACCFFNGFTRKREALVIAFLESFNKLFSCMNIRTISKDIEHIIRQGNLYIE